MLFGESIDILEGLQITLLGMLVVFLALVFLMAILVLMEKTIYKKAKPDTPYAQVKGPQTDLCIVQDEENQEDVGELTAVMAAAIAYGSGITPSELVIKNIKREENTTPAWNMAGNAEQMRRMLG